MYCLTYLRHKVKGIIGSNKLIENLELMKNASYSFYYHTFRMWDKTTGLPVLLRQRRVTR